MCMAVMITIGLSGCMLDTPEDECIVREKESGGEAQVAAAEGGLTIESQVQAESTCKSEITDGFMEVLVHADVKVPDGDGMKIRSAEAKYFNQEDLDGWVQALCQGKKLWYFAPGSTSDMSIIRSEMEAWMNELTDQLAKTDQMAASSELTGEDADEAQVRLEMLQSWITSCQYYLDSGTLPETRQSIDVDWAIQNWQSEEENWDTESVSDAAESMDGDAAEEFDENTETEAAEAEVNDLENEKETLLEGLYGYVDIQDIFAPWASSDEKTYICDITNCRDSGYSSAAFSFTRRYRGDYVPWTRGQTAKNVETQISRKQMKNAADDLVHKMGFSDELKYIKSEAVYGTIDYDPYGTHFLEESKGWRFYYVRELDGIKMTHVPNDMLSEDSLQNFAFDLETAFGWEEKSVMNNTAEQFQTANTRWDEECFCVTFDDEGLVSVVWVNPCEISENSSDNVFLLPFSEIQQIFEKSITKQYVLELISQMDIPIKADVTEIRLGYMQVAEDGKTGSGQIIPVWDFIGTYESTVVKEALSDMDNSWVQYYLETKESDSLLTVNATDGTIINWGYGH